MDLYLKARKLAQEKAQQIIDGIKPDEYFVENDECKETIYLLSDPEQRTILLKKFDQNEKQKRRACNYAPGGGRRIPLSAQRPERLQAQMPERKGSPAAEN